MYIFLHTHTFSFVMLSLYNMYVNTHTHGHTHTSPCMKAGLQGTYFWDTAHVSIAAASTAWSPKLSVCLSVCLCLSFFSLSLARSLSLFLHRSSDLFTCKKPHAQSVSESPTAQSLFGKFPKTRVTFGVLIRRILLSRVLSIYVYICIYVYIYMYVCICICICIYIYSGPVCSETPISPWRRCPPKLYTILACTGPEDWEDAKGLGF